MSKVVLQRKLFLWKVTFELVCEKEKHLVSTDMQRSVITPFRSIGMSYPYIVHALHRVYKDGGAVIQIVSMESLGDVVDALLSAAQKGD